MMDLDQWQKEGDSCEHDDGLGCCTFGCLWWFFSFPVAIIVYLVAWIIKKVK